MLKKQFCCIYRKSGPKTVEVTQVVHSAKVDHKFNAVAKPFGASSSPSQLSQPQVATTGRTSPAGGGSSWQPPPVQGQRAPASRTGPVGVTAQPVPPAPAPPSVVQSR